MYTDWSLQGQPFQESYFLEINLNQQVTENDSKQHNYLASIWIAIYLTLVKSSQDTDLASKEQDRI